MAQDDDARFIARSGTLATAGGPEAELTGAVRRLPATEADAYVDGTFAGAIGAAVIALFFLAIDLAEGVPLRTPGALGAALFLGRSVAPETAPALALVLGYSVVHALMFVTAGVVASLALIGRRKPLGPLSGLGLAAALFAGLQVFFVAVIWLAAPQLVAEFGVGRIATANLLASGAMSVGLLRPRRERVPMLGKRVVVGVLLGLMFSASFLVYWCSSAYVDLAQ